MRKLVLVLSVVIFTSVLVSAQTRLTGFVKVAESETPLPGVTVTLLNQNISAKTNAQGEFNFSYLAAGDEEISFSRSGYLPQIKVISLKENELNDAGIIFMRVDIQEESRQDAILQLNESDFSEDEGRASQSISSSLSRGDVYLSQTSYNFSPMRFRMRGYEQEFESTYVNGVHFNALDRGGFNYSSLGGLNDANRNKDVVMGSEANSFSYGNLGGNTNILNR
ncbi:MAG: carboxypeptidase-like regulatory domain-containing protein, partial [Paludibacteraceae bacterium]|nr:carboxypeptidase-like regulatory domain-containing protein [Paludibacteraceae bacterium]